MREPRQTSSRPGLAPLRRLVVGGGLAVALLGGCSSSGGDGTGEQSIALANRCAVDNPYVTAALQPPASRRDERAWAAAYVEEAYLWPGEVPDVDPEAPHWDTGSYLDGMRQWFAALRTPAVTATGRPKDRYSFLYPAAEYRRIADAGVLHGYGLEWRIEAATPRRVQVAYVNPSTPAASAGVVRGDTVEAVTVDGVTVSADVTDAAGVALLNRALYPPRGSATRTFRMRSPAGTVRELALEPGDVTTRPVLAAAVFDGPVFDPTLAGAGLARIGYLVVNDFVAPAEGQLVAAFERFRAERIAELVVDLRYNGGGYLYLSSQLATMIAGSARVDGPVFERFRYNDRRMAVLAPAQTDIRFASTTTGYPGSGTAAGVPLPALALQRVVVLTTADTCSASESVVNGLEGVDFPVVRIGSATCGKPYGFSARDNCGLSYFPIEFQGVNAKGFGDYDDGFAPTCAAADDLSRPLGDRAEGLLDAALAYLATGRCPAVVPAGKARGDPSIPAAVPRDPLRRSRYLRDPAPGR